MGWQIRSLECGPGWASPRSQYRTRHSPLAGLVFSVSNIELAVIEQREFELPADSADIGLRKE